MKIEALNCPNCGGSLNGVEIQDGKSEVYCPYCGTKILLSDENTHTYIHKHIDTAKEKELALKESEAASRAAQRKMAIDILDRERKTNKNCFIVFLVAAVLCLLVSIIGVRLLDYFWFTLASITFIGFFICTLLAIIFGFIYWSKNKAYHKLTTKI